MDYRVAIDGGATGKGYMKAFGVNGIPHAFIVQEKKIIWHYEAPEGFEVHVAQPIGQVKPNFFMPITIRFSKPMTFERYADRADDPLVLGEVGLDRTQVAIVNVLKCRPPGNRDPHPDEIEACRPYLEGQLDHMRPRVIITLGNFATRFITGLQIGITKARGQRFEYKDAIVIPTFHPAAALRGGRFGGMSPVDAIREDFQLVGQALAEQRARFAPAAAPTEQPHRSAEEIAASEQLGLF